MRVMNSKTFSIGNFDVEFILYQTASCINRPCGLSANVTRKEKERHEYAFLQVYEESFGNGLKLGPYIDNEKCNNRKVPFYSASIESIWNGKLTDEPTDNQICSWELHMYTLFCEVDTSGSDEDPLKWKYIKGAGVEWGFKKDSPNKISCFGLEIMEKADIDSKFKVIKDAFPGLKFCKNNWMSRTKVLLSSLSG